MARHKIRNISGEDLVVPWLDHRVVIADEVVTVPEADLASYLCQPHVWQAGDDEAEAAYTEEVQAAEVQFEAEVKALIEAMPEPWAPEPVALGAEASLDAPAPQQQPVEAPAAEAQPTETQESPAPTPEPAAAQDDEAQEAAPEEGERHYSPRLQQLLDRTSAPSTSTFTGSLPVQPRL